MTTASLPMLKDVRARLDEAGFVVLDRLLIG